MRRFLYKYFSGDYLHVLQLMASHYRLKRELSEFDRRMRQAEARFATYSVTSNKRGAE